MAGSLGTSQDVGSIDGAQTDPLESTRGGGKQQASKRQNFRGWTWAPTKRRDANPQLSRQKSLNCWIMEKKHGLPVRGQRVPRATTGTLRVQKQEFTWNGGTQHFNN